MFIEVLLALQSVATNGHPVVGSIKNIGVLKLTHGREFLEHSGDLMINILAACKLPSNLITDRAFVTILPDSADSHLITQTGVTVVKRMFGQPVQRQLRSLLIRRRQRLAITMVHRPVLL